MEATCIRKVAVVLAVLSSFFNINSSAQVPAFPGADGYGRYTQGGRGGTVYYVTTLDDSDEQGTLRYGVTRLSKAVIMFKVSGTIHLNSPLNISASNITIAGQSAPGDGICIADYPVSVSGSQVIIRYMRFRMGDRKLNADEADGADALGGRFSTDVIIDHCSISWSTDECCSFYANTNFTMQWCLVTESLRESLHSKGTHGYGAIWGGLGASFYHNMLAHHGSRTPRFGTGDHKDRPDLHMVDMRNCVNYNYAGNGCYGAEGMHINLVNNYYKWGPATETASCRNKLISPGYATHSNGVTAIWGKYYLDGNVVTGNGNVTADNWLGVSFKGNSSMENGMVTAADLKSDTAMGQIPEFHQHTADMAYDKVLRYVGCSKSRDSYDARIIEEAATGTALFRGSKGGLPGLIDTVEDLRPDDAADDWNPWPELAQGEAPQDTDGDGMPDAWEQEHGLDPYNADDGNRHGSDGYTMLDVYLASLVADITEGQYEGSELMGVPGEPYTTYDYATTDSVTWPMGSNSDAQAASISGNGNVAEATYSKGEGLEYSSKTTTYNNITFTTFTPAEESKTPSDAAYVDYAVRPRYGTSIVPSSITFDAIRIGTGGTAIDIAWIDGNGTETTLAEGIKPVRNDNSEEYKKHTIELSEVKREHTAGVSTLRFYLYNYAPGKGIGLANVALGLNAEGGTNAIMPPALSQPNSATEPQHYDLAGRRVSPDAKGIVIVNGKKVIR